MERDTVTLPQVIGNNVNRIRGGHTLEEVATFGRSLGAKWSSGSVSAIERGDFKATIETLALLALALDRLEPEGKTMRGTITVRDLLQTDHLIALGETHRSSTEHLLQFLGGAPSGSVFDTQHFRSIVDQSLRAAADQIKSLNLPNDMPVSQITEMEQHPMSSTEERLAKKISVDVLELRYWAFHLWGLPFEAHRDEVAGIDSTPQKKGRVTRQLLEEVQSAMRVNADGND